MAEDNARPVEESGAVEVERKPDRPSRLRDQRTVTRVKDKAEEGRLPTPPPDPQCPRDIVVARDRSTGVTPREPDDEEDDLAVYLGELGASPFDGRSFDYDTNTPNSAMGGDAGLPFAEEAFEHLDRMCALTEQVLELRDRSCKLFRRVRGLERAKVQRSADRRLEIAISSDEELLNDYADEDTGFAESLLDAMLSNCRDAASTPRRNERSSMRSPASSRQRSRSLALAEQMPCSTGALSVIDGSEMAKPRNADRNGGPKVSKWTRVKAAFKWERACANDLPDIAEANTPVATSPTTTRYLRIPDVTTAGSWSGGSALSPCTSEMSSPSTPIGRVSSASSSNEEVFDDTRKGIINYPERQLMKDDKKKEDAERYSRSFDTPITDNADSTEPASETNRGKPLIRIISDADMTMRVASGSGGKDPELSPKRPTPTLTITIPSNEEEIRSLSSPDSASPLLSSAQDSGGSSPQRPKARQDVPSPREFKRQYSTIEETITPAPKIQRQDSKWNKVRRAFLTNATFSVPPSPVKVITAQSFANDDTRRTRSCSESIEDLGKTIAGTNNNYYRAEARRDYQALREKFGAEFHRKLIEWERLKSTRNARDGLPLSEERLAPEFRKKLQDWKRAKKGRRSSSTVIEQQRVSRRRLTDWQLWRSSSSKPDPRCYGRNQNSIGSRGSCASIGSAGSYGSDGRQHLCEDFVKRMEAWRRMSEAACRGGERPRSPINRVASDIIDETEFLALEKLLLLFEQRTRKERRESDAKQLNDCFDGDSRFTAASRRVNCGNEVLIRTSVGSYRFEGISREFTRKLYDWEKYRGISPRSSTFRLLGPGYTPFAQDSDEAALAESSTAGKNRAFHWTLKRSKSDGSVFEGGIRDESFTLRRSTSLQSLNSADKLEDARMDSLPASKNKDTEDIAVEDSEPEAMIVDIEDVIEETASPLAGVQPHQTPVYSVAASETISIAVPLGTVTSSHEPSPVFLVDAEENGDRGWNGKKWIGPEALSSENSPSSEYLPISEDWRGGTACLEAEAKSNRNSWCEESDKGDDNTMESTEKMRRSILDDDCVKSERLVGWNRDAWDESSDETNRDSMGFELPLTPIYESRNDTRQDLFENDEDESARFVENFRTSSTIWNAEGLTVHLKDSSRTCKETNETGKIEDPADKSNSKRISDAEDLQDGENNGEAERKKVIHGTDYCTYQLTRTSSSPDCRDSKEASSKLSSLNSDDNKDLPECGDLDVENDSSAHYESCSSPESQTEDADRHYEFLTFKTDTRDDTDDNRLYEPINCYENHTFFHDDRNNSVKEHLSLSSASGMKKANLLETLSDSTIRTIPITVSRNDNARCLERILINEETLDKIIVPTANAESERDMESRRDCVMNIDRIDEVATRTIRDQSECIRKDSSASRNVFVKTKRMLFGPFRRSEDRSASRKESDVSVNGRLSRSSKSKSKSRSASPKLHRQDALLRVSLSLPWPLRSTSKENEIPSEAESRRNSGSKAEDAITTREKNQFCGKADSKRSNRSINQQSTFVDVNQERVHQDSRNARSIGISFTGVPERVDQNARRMRDEINRDDQARLDEERNEEKQGETKRDTEQNEARQQEQNCDAVSSDLMHKLRILSDAAARREGRVISAEASVSNSLESRSSRIRRAKESFLSHRGGPFCSTMEAETANYGDPWRRSSMSQTSTIETTKSNETATITSNYEGEGIAGSSAEVQVMQEEATSEDKVDACQENLGMLDVGVRSESLVKSASAGMINVDPDTFGRLVDVDRGCESLPRTIAKRRDSANPLAKIVNKLKFSRLIRARNTDNGGNMSTISTLCRQSLLIDMRGNNRNRSHEQETGNQPVEAAGDQSENDRPDGDPETTRE